MTNSFYEHSGYPPGSRARNSSQKLRNEFLAIEAGAQAIEAALDLKADYSALVDIYPATAGADKILVTNATGDGWEYPAITAAGKALLDDASAAAQRATLGIGANIGKNLLINGGFDVWQDGTSFTAIGTYYTADGWEFVNGPGGGGVEKATSGVIITHTFDGAQTFRQKVENVTKFSDTSVTFSFDAWDDLASWGISLSIKATQNFGTGGTPAAPVVVSAAEMVEVTSSRVRYQVTIALPSTSGKTLGTNNDSFLMIEVTPSQPAFEKAVGLDRCQLEFGDTATDFEYRHPAEELALCQRYYEKGTLSGPFAQYETNFAVGPQVSFLVEKRRTPLVTLGTLYATGHDGTLGALFDADETTRSINPSYSCAGGTVGRSFFGQVTWTADARL